MRGLAPDFLATRPGILLLFLMLLLIHIIGYLSVCLSHETDTFAYLPTPLVFHIFINKEQSQILVVVWNHEFILEIPPSHELYFFRITLINELGEDLQDITIV